MDIARFRQYQDRHDAFFQEIKVEPDRSGKQEVSELPARFSDSLTSYQQDAGVKYGDWLQTTAWREKRDAVISLAGKCWVCGARWQLQAHHMTYERVTNESPGDLLVLCRTHHRHVHFLAEDHGRFDDRSYAWLLAMIKTHRKFGLSIIAPAST